MVGPITRVPLRQFFAATLVGLALALGATKLIADARAPEVRNIRPAPWTKPVVERPDEFSFAVIGDNTGLARPGVFRQAMAQAGWLRPNFIMSVGDLIEGYTENRDDLLSEWADVDAAVAQAKVPFLYVAGNHDIGNATMLNLWKKRHGNPYYSLVYKDVLFLVLDSEDPPMDLPDSASFRALVKELHANPDAVMERLRKPLADVNAKRDALAQPDPQAAKLNQSRFSDAQVEFVRSTLAKHSGVRWTMVFMHKPGWKADSGNFPKIEALLADRPYTMIAGHYHYYERALRRGREHIVMGTTGGISHQEGPGKMDHIAWITMHSGSEGPEVALLRLDGILNRDGVSGQSKTY